MSGPVVLDAPAKLNLGLRILARRPDGYHEIESVMIPIALFDTLRAERGSRPGIHLECEGAALPAGPENLAVRGAAAACRALGIEPRLELRLTKRIPIAAGLGGGSSDAAAALLAVERLAGARIAAAERLACARALGADVPFFLDPRPALARGVGERLEALAEVPELVWALVALPFAVLTAEVYSAASRELTLPRPPSTIAALSALARDIAGDSGVTTSGVATSGAATSGVATSGVATSGVATGVGWPENDLERVTGRRHPEIGAVQRSLRKLGARVTGMSGSGPTVYGNFTNRAAAEEALAQAALPDGARAWVVTSAGSRPTEPSWGVAKR